MGMPLARAGSAPYGEPVERKDCIMESKTGSAKTPESKKEKSKGQKSSSERGAATSKKSPGKRPQQGGGSR
jgi:hypothetical protein